MMRRLLRLSPVLVCFITFMALSAGSIPGAAQVAVTTYHNDNARTGLNAQERLLTPANVNPSTFGKLSSCDLTGNGGATNAYVYAQPLYVPNVLIGGASHNVVYVATERNQVFAFDADSNPCHQLWKKTFEPFISPNQNQNYLADTIGIQSTPVIDINTNTMYFVSATGADGANQQLLHAIDISTGTDKPGSPVTIAGSVAGTGDGNSVDIFDPNLQNQRPGLLMANGNIYIAWGSYDDHGEDTIPSYHGWVMAYDATTLQRKAIFNTTPNGHAGSTWALGALSADTTGNVYVGSANGNSSCSLICDDTDPANGNFAHAYLRLDSQTLAVQDYFIPAAWLQETFDDQDVNGGGALLLPDQPGAHPHLLIWGTKGGQVYLLDRDNMGHLSMSGSDNQVVQAFQAWTTDSCNSDDDSCVRTLPAYWNGNVYFLVQNHGLQSYRMNNGLLSTTPTSEDTSVIYPLRGAPITVSANGNTNGIVWAVNHQRGLNATLYAYDANDASKILYSSNQNQTRDGLDQAQNFTSATVADGKVYVATRNTLHIFGLLPAGPPAAVAQLSTTSLAFSAQEISTASASQPVTLTNAGGTALVITSIKASGDFSQSNDCGATVAAGASCTIAVTFRPTVPGVRTGSITITDSAAGSPHVISLTGTGVIATAGPADFAIAVVPPSVTVASGQPANYAVTITPQNGFTGQVTLLCTGLPAHAACFFNPIQVDASKGTATLQINTAMALADASDRNRVFYAALTSSFSIFGLVLLLPSRRRKIFAALCTIVISTCLFQIGCGGRGLVSSTSNPSTQGTTTPPGTYSVTVLGTSGSLQHSAIVQLVVQ